MLTYVSDSIFSSPAAVLVNTVNTVGVMGKGIAFEFKRLFPEMFERYQKECEAGRFDVGNLMLYATPNKWILNFPTKKHWRSPSRVEYIEAGLETFIRTYRDHDFASVAFPQLGCGNGELDWETQVRPVMEHYLSALPVEIYVHLYTKTGSREHRITPEMKRWLRGEPRSLSVFEVWDDLFDSPMPGPEPDLSDGDPGAEVESVRVLRWVWEQLRAFGFVSVREAREQCGDEGEKMLARLAELPYVETTSFVPIRGARKLVHESTEELLAAASASGIRLAPEQLPETRIRQLPIQTGQLQLALLG